MRRYVVGGAVRDALLGLPVADRDWVVVGATPEEMTAAGFRPVGKDFPVFLHPETQEEHALARTERKSGRGYKGFTVHAAPDVTLEEDLRRRDLTINAMAQDENGRLIDPFGGERDLRVGVLRHVSEAFAEDPLRVLRVARFAARFGFRIADETLGLMRRLVDAGEMQALVPERVWQELARGLAEPQPARMFDALVRCGAQHAVLPELDAVLGDAGRRAALAGALERAVRASASLPERVAVLAHALDAQCEEGMTALCARLRVPNEVQELSLAVCRCGAGLRAAADDSPAQLLATLKCVDAFRRPERLAALLRTLACAQPGEGSAQAGRRLTRALEAARTVDAGAIAAGSAAGDIAARIDAARECAIAGAV
ncbi:MAG TPA: multifunctional CCA tRNA nucleotidyl transferase/2'3'-cyclic phosphodiesterase/2'nucleotidase/phosphatase [Burkholderiales bacterium]|nr:multifunctional CCA tRNA nucleotidyl transferase/2'3'-cyclic phosphodiesterase/2'nucleotidase/phosphatase [Burkholderiales bacterium]